jgi:4a-hydroxytetrahydrobiopterin dehydratase
MARNKLTREELEVALNDLPGWIIRDGKLHKEFKFGSFARAIGWMVTVAIEAERLNHHPEWCNVYNRVTVNLVTHHLGNAISDADVKLAQFMETAMRED